MGWVQTGGGQSSPGEPGKPTFKNRHGLGTSRFRLPLSFFNVHFTTTYPARAFMVSVCKSIQQTRTRFHTGSGSNTPDCRSSFLRIAYYLFTVLSAVLTIGSLRGERITLPTETYSAPLRSGASSPTFINEVVVVGVLSSGIFCYFWYYFVKTYLTEPLPV